MKIMLKFVSVKAEMSLDWIDDCNERAERLRDGLQ